MENIEFKDALLRLADRAGYNSTFVLRDIEIREFDETFITQRLKIEQSIHLAAKKVYTSLKNSGVIAKQDLYNYFEDLWRWYDGQQTLLDIKLFQGQNSQQFVVILYKLHEAFLQKLHKIENTLGC